MKTKIVKAPDGRGNILYRITKGLVRLIDMRGELSGTKEEILARAAKTNAKNRSFIMPSDNKAYYTDHIIYRHHCLEINSNKYLMHSDKRQLF